MIRIGTAGWSLPKRWQDRFPEGESHLGRYSVRLNAAEINQTFYKTPRPSTFERWAATVPAGFRFAVKLPREITHRRKLEAAHAELVRFMEAVAKLGERLGPLLIQLPPSLTFNPSVAESFLRGLRRLRDGPDALEPRHVSWFAPAVEALLAEYRVARVAADPPRAETDGTPGGFRGLAYFRLHGSPVMYRSAYRDDSLSAWAERVRAAAKEADEVWCIFDNTALGEATGDALALRSLLARR